MNKLLAILPIVFVLLVSGCSQGPSPKAEPDKTIPVEVGGGSGSTPVASETPTAPEPIGPAVKEFKLKITHEGGYEPPTFTVTQGDTVKFLATSDPVTHKHGITIDEYTLNVEVTKKAAESPQAIEFVADKAGEFTIYCKTCLDGFGPHPWMVGKLTVE